MSKEILISGSTGFLGTNLLAYLKEKTDWKLVKTDWDLTKHLEVNLGKFDAVINLASVSSVPVSIKNPASVIQTNVAIAVNMLEYAREYPTKLFIQFSTVEAYNPASPYAASKAAQEEIASAYQNTYGVPVVIVTSHNIVGPGQSPDKFVPRVIEQIKNDETVSIYTDKGTMGYRVYNSVKNVADALLFILNQPPPTSLMRYDIPGGEELTNLEMAQRISKLMGKELKYKTVEAQSVRPGYTRHLTTNGIQLDALGWQPVQTLDDCLREIVEAVK